MPPKAWKKRRRQAQKKKKRKLVLRRRIESTFHNMDWEWLFQPPRSSQWLVLVDSPVVNKTTLRGAHISVGFYLSDQLPWLSDPGEAAVCLGELTDILTNEFDGLCIASRRFLLDKKAKDATRKA